MALIMHVNVRRSSFKDAKYSPSKTKNKDPDTSVASSAKFGIDEGLQELLSWAGELFIIHHVNNTSKVATPPLQGKRKQIHIQGHKSRRRGSSKEISNATDEDTNGKTYTSEASRITLVTRIAATIKLKISFIMVPDMLLRERRPVTIRDGHGCSAGVEEAVFSCQTSTGRPAHRRTTEPFRIHVWTGSKKRWMRIVPLTATRIL